ncbi:MAG: hypothetical protein AAF639_34845, partial [Chloroflexota bacterium]
MISESRTSVYDILIAQQEGDSPYEMCVIYNLQSLQVQVALEYIDEHRERLEAELPELLEKKAEREQYYRAVAAEREKRPIKQTPLQQAYEELKAKNKIRAANGEFDKYHVANYFK